MVGLDWRAVRAAWSVFLLAVVVAAAFLVRRTLLIFVAALLFAYLLSPVVNLIDRLARARVSRNLSLAVVYVLLLAVLVGIGSLIGSTVAEQAAGLAAKLPDFMKRIEGPIDIPMPKALQPMKAEILAGIRTQMEEHAKDVIPWLQSAGKGLLSFLGNITFFVLVPILSFFLLKDGRRIHDQIVEAAGTGPRRQLLEDIFADVHLLLAQFMRALVVLSAATFVFYAGFLAVIGAPYAVLLSVVAGLLEFIPVLGPLSAAVIILAVAGFSGFPHLAWIVIFLVAYRLFQDYVLQPYLMSAGVELHPLLVIFGALAGQQIAGVPGMFLSVPVLATLRVVYVRLRKAARAPVAVEAVR